MGWTLRSAQPDSSGASQKKKTPPLSPEPRTTEKERLGGGETQAEGPHSAARRSLGSSLRCLPFSVAVSLPVPLCLSPFLLWLLFLSPSLFLSVSLSPVLSFSFLCFCRSLPPCGCLLLRVRLSVCVLLSRAPAPEVSPVAGPEQGAGRPEAGEGTDRARAQQPRRGEQGRGDESCRGRAGGTGVAGNLGARQATVWGTALGRGTRPVASP